MFRASIPRHARLGSVSCRHLTTAPALRSVVSHVPLRSVPAKRDSQIPAFPAALRQSAARFYSGQAAAASSKDAPSDDGFITKFADLPQLGIHQSLTDALTQGMGYETMTPVQAKTINPAMKGVDLVAQAKTGTGKTLAFLIPIMQRLLADDPTLASRVGFTRPSSKDIKALILSPTRELAEQIAVEAKKLTRHTGIVVQTAVGGTQKREAMYKMRREGCHILVATPGRLIDILEDPQSGVEAPSLHTLVLDEADRMLDVGFSDAIRDIFRALPSRDVVDRQTLLFSATIPPSVVGLAKDMVKQDNFEFVQTIDPNEPPTHERVPQFLVPVNSYENWFPVVTEIMDKANQKAIEDPQNNAPFKAIMFFSQTAAVQFAAKTFSSIPIFGRRTSLPVYDIHSKLTQAQRTNSAESFRRSKSGILISSDVTARGMDFPGVTHVFQVGLPPDRDQYIHRVGRTGRAGKSGEGWLILAESEIPEARIRLPNLPIKPRDDVELAGVDLARDELPPSAEHYVKMVQSAYKRVYPEWFESLYYVMLGQKFGRSFRAEDAVRMLNAWSAHLGLEETPALSQRSAMTRGLYGIPGLRIGRNEEQGRGRGGPDGGRGGFRRGDDAFRREGGSQRRGNSFEDKFMSATRDGNSFGGRGRSNRRGGFQSSSF